MVSEGPERAAAGARGRTARAPAVPTGDASRRLPAETRAVLEAQRTAGNAGVGSLLRPAREPGERIRRALRSPAVPLDASVRRVMEARLRADLSDVRVHAGEEASESAAAIGAHAYTAGNHLVFQKGAYAPHTDAGLRVLAHELAHVVQQRFDSLAGPPAGAGLEIGERESPAERAADDAARDSLWPRLDTGRGRRRGAVT
ncbi:MAG: DUF4157 domain-containing protein [Actinomycetota bacterium]